MNVNAPPASPPKEYLVLDTQRPDFGRRRATLATVPGAVNQRHSMDEPRIKMTTWDEGHEEDAISSSGIGIALSSPTQPTPKHDRRRSRSADALHNLFKDRASSDRNRSAEIKYWRESYMSGSIYSRPDTARTIDSTPETAKTMETIRSVQMNEPTIQEPDTESFNEMSATLVQADDPQTPTPMAEEPPTHEEHEDGYPPVSAFNFGELKTAAFDAPAEATVENRHSTDVSAPPAPPVRRESRVSLEDRVNHLESRYSNLESMTRRISSRNNRETIILENAPRNLRSRNRSVSASAAGSRSHSRSAPSIHQEPMRHSVETANADYAPGSPTHVSMPPAVGEDSAKALRYVYEALKHERSARKALESQVRTLQHDVSDLHALVNKLIASATATSPSYPTPSPDTLVSTSEVDQHMSCSTPRAPTHYDRGHGYSNDANQWKRDSGSLYDGEEESDRQPAFDESATPDVWATPKEEGFSNNGGFFSSEDKTRGYA